MKWLLSAVLAIAVVAAVVGHYTNRSRYQFGVWTPSPPSWDLTVSELKGPGNEYPWSATLYIKRNGWPMRVEMWKTREECEAELASLEKRWEATGGECLKRWDAR